MLKPLNSVRGFTLIEVVIVLAIAALIIVVVLNAVASAQKSQRDTTRKTEAARISALMEQYAGNNSGNYPAVAVGNDFATGASNVPLGSYDLNLANKYSNIAVSGTCPAQNAGDFNVMYTPTLAAQTTYTLSVCLESTTVPVTIH